MLNKIREQEIMNILRTQSGFVTTKSLCEQLYASESSIRRDLKALEEKGLIRRAYGGAEPVVGTQKIVTFNHRTRQNEKAKRNIAKKAAEMINNGEILFLDQSSTSFYLASELIRKKITVITNNIEILVLLSDSRVHTVSSGGYLSENNKTCLIGNDAVSTFDNIYADKVFFSSNSISKDGIITDCDREEIIVRNTMINNAKKKIFLCDSSKYDKIAQYKQCHLNALDVMISEEDSVSFYKDAFPDVEML